MTRLAPSRWLFHVSTGAVFLTDCLLSPLVPTPVLYAIPLGLIPSASPRELRSVAWLATGLGLVAHVMSLREAPGAELLLSRLLSLVPVWTMALCLGRSAQAQPAQTASRRAADADDDTAGQKATSPAATALEIPQPSPTADVLDVSELFPESSSADTTRQFHMARRLHNDLGQSLTVVSLLLEMMTEPAEAADQESLRQAQDEVAQMIGKVRTFTTDLGSGVQRGRSRRQPAARMDVQNAHRRICRMIDEIQSLAHRTGSAPADSPSLPEDETLTGQEDASAAAAVIGDLLTRTLTQTGSQTEVRVRLHQGNLVAAFTEPGAWTESPLNPAVLQELAGVNDRINALGGELLVSPAGNGATRVQLRLPLPTRSTGNGLANHHPG